jgi:AcrR family transcriptional regulator
MSRNPRPSDCPRAAQETHAGDSRRVLLDAALHCFAHQGYDGTSIRDIAARADRNSSLISHHFGGKEGLYEAVFRMVLDAHQPFVRDFGQAPGTREGAAGRLRELIRLLCSDFAARSGSEDPVVVLGRKLVLGELREPRPSIVALLREHMSPWMRQFSHCLCLVRPDLAEVQSRFLGICIMGETMAHTMLQEIRPFDWGFEEIDSAMALDLLTEFNLRALGVQAPESQGSWQRPFDEVKHET